MQKINIMIFANSICVVLTIVLTMMLSSILNIDLYIYHQDTGKIKPAFDFANFPKIVLLIFFVALFVYFCVYNLLGVRGVYQN